MIALQLCEYACAAESSIVGTEDVVCRESVFQMEASRFCESDRDSQ